MELVGSDCRVGMWKRYYVERIRAVFQSVLSIMQCLFLHINVLNGVPGMQSLHFLKSLKVLLLHELYRVGQRTFSILDSDDSCLTYIGTSLLELFQLSLKVIVLPAGLVVVIVAQSTPTVFMGFLQLPPFLDHLL